MSLTQRFLNAVTDAASSLGAVDTLAQTCCTYPR